MYTVEKPKTNLNPGNHIIRIRLSLSGGNLLVKTGGGFKLFTEWLGDKKLVETPRGPPQSYE